MKRGDLGVPPGMPRHRARSPRAAAFVAAAACAAGGACELRDGSLDAAPFEAARAACGPAPDDAVLFVHQAVTGRCTMELELFQRPVDRLTIEIEYADQDDAVVLAITDNMSDDLVRARALRFQLRRIATPGSHAPAGAHWRIVRVGSSWLCRRGHHTEAYGTLPCR